MKPWRDRRVKNIPLQMDHKVLIWAVFLFGGCFATDPNIELEELKGRDFLLLLNKKSSENYNKETLADWGYASNITEANLQNQVSLLLS